MKLYTYTKKTRKPKKLLLAGLTTCFVGIVATMTYFAYQDSIPPDQSVVATPIDVPVIALPKEEEKASKPFKVDANIVLDYFDGSEGEIESMTKFEGVYRANQGIDYACNDEEFDVYASLSGEVVDVKQDELFGYSVTIASGDLKITYQSLKDMKKSVGDQVKQGDALSLASTNIYNKDLKNHLHVVVEKSGTRIDPESIYGKTLNELK